PRAVGGEEVGGLRAHRLRIEPQGDIHDVALDIVRNGVGEGIVRASGEEEQSDQAGEAAGQRSGEKALGKHRGAGWRRRTRITPGSPASFARSGPAGGRS